MKQIGTGWNRDNRNAINDNFDEADQRIKEQKDRVNRIITENPQPSEVVDARGDFDVLGDRLDDTNAQLAQKASYEDLSNAVSPKAEKDYVDTQIANVASGTPKGAFETLSQLETAYPTGDTGIYVVSADGHWYYWNDSAWTSGGVYQSTLWQNALTTQDAEWSVV